MMLLALDTARRSGFAWGNPGDTPQWGVYDYGPHATGEIGARFRAWLGGLVDRVEPDLIAFEAPYLPRGKFANALTIRRLNGLAFTVETLCAERHIRCYEASILDIAKYFLGTSALRRDEKKAATIEMCGRYGWHVTDDNAADSLALWAMAEATIDAAAARRRGVGPLFIPQPSKTKRPRSAQPGALNLPIDEERHHGSNNRSNNKVLRQAQPIR